MRPLLRSDVVRHAVCTAIMLAVALASPLVVGGEDARARSLTRIAASFLGMGLYGVVYLVLTSYAFRSLVGEPLRDELNRARRRGPRWLRRLFGMGPRAWTMSVAAMAVMGVLVLAIGSRTPLWLALAGIVCVLGAWVLLLGVFAQAYADLWAQQDAFRFPDPDAHRRFGDFFYLSIQVSTTFSSSDVDVLGRRARSAVSAHCITAWVFSTVLIALLLALVLPT